MSEQPIGKILVVDDTAANRYAAVRILKTAGHHVLEASTAAEGIALAQREQPNVILLDVKLPDMVGFEATELLKCDPQTSHIAILQVSASYTSADARALGLERGADAYLTLPIEPQVLIATVNAMLRLHRAERELQEAVRSRDEFLSIASHDLRTPLTSIQLTMELVMRTLDRHVPPEAAEKLMPHLNRVTDQAKRLTHMLENLLDISQVSAGTVSLHLEPVDLCSLVQEAVARYREEIDKAGSAVNIQAQGSVVGQWDRLRLDQVVSNLVSNAIKYGEGKPIDVTVETVDGRARLAVQDHGVGIAPEEQARIFKRFERGTRGRKSGSYGLGLWIVQRIVDAFGGRISVRSAPGEGSTFTVELPLQGHGSGEPDGRSGPDLRLISGQ